MPATREPSPGTENGSHQPRESTNTTPPWELNNAAQVPYIKPKSSNLNRAERQALPSLRGTQRKYSDEQQQQLLRGRDDSTNRKANSIDKQFNRPSEEASRTPSKSPPLTAIRSTQRAPYDPPPSISPALRSAPPPPPTVPYETIILPPAPKTAPHRLPSFVDDQTPPNASNSIGGTHSRSGSSQAPIVKAIPGTMSARVGEEKIPGRSHSDHGTQSPEIGASASAAGAAASPTTTTTRNLPTDDKVDIQPKFGKRLRSALKGIFKRRSSTDGGGGGGDDNDDQGYEEIGGGKHWTDEDY